MQTHYPNRDERPHTIDDEKGAGIRPPNPAPAPDDLLNTWQKATEAIAREIPKEKRRSFLAGLVLGFLIGAASGVFGLLGVAAIW